MDINLNVPINNKSNFLGNSSSTFVEAGKDVFTDIFANLEEVDDDSKDVDPNILLTLLNNLQIKNTEDNVEVVDEQGIDLNKISNVNDFYMDGQKIDINNDKVSLSDSTYSRYLNNEELELVKKIENSNSLTNKSDMSNANDINYKDALESNINIYEDLEISSLNNKNNIVKSSYINKGDKELSTLESIVNYEELEITKPEIKEIKIEEMEITKPEILESNTVDIEKGLNNLDTNSKNDEFIFINNTNLNKDLSSIENNDNTVISHIRKEFVSEDVVKTVKYLKTNGMEEITIKISPRELGDMTIKLIKNGDETTVDITINKEDVFSLVNDNISEITKHLEDLNISVKDVSVNTKSSNQNYFSHNFNEEFDRKNQHNHEKFNKKEILNNEEENDESDNTRGENNLNILV